MKRSFFSGVRGGQRKRREKGRARRGGAKQGVLAGKQWRNAAVILAEF
jgi:hypothetical protein